MNNPKAIRTIIYLVVTWGSCLLACHYFGFIAFVIWLFTIYLAMCFEGATLSLHGWYINNKTLYYCLTHQPVSVHLNPFDSGFIYINGLCFFSNPLSPLSKWYISGKGPVFRWSKSHKLIQQYYEQAKKQPTQNPLEL